MDAHLVFDGPARHAIARAQRTVVVHQHLGHHEQRNALRAVRRARRLRQHEVDDVVGQVVLARRDEDLGAGDGVAAIGLRFGLGADHAQIGAAMRLGQVHRAEPFARDHLGQVLFLLLWRALGDQRGNRACRQAGIHRERHVGRGHELLHRKAKHMRHALPAELFGCRDGAPSAFAILCKRFLEALGRRHSAIFVARAAFDIADLIERREHFGAELAGLVDDGVDHVGRGALEAGQIAVALQVEHFIDDEARVAGRGGVNGHENVLLRKT